MSSSSVSPQRQITTRILPQQKLEVTSRDDDMAVAPSIPIAASLMIPRLRSPADVATAPAAVRFAAENQASRDEREQMRASRMNWESSVGRKAPFATQTKRLTLRRGCRNSKVGRCTRSKSKDCGRQQIPRDVALSMPSERCVGASSATEHRTPGDASASHKNQALEQQLHVYGQHMEMS